MDEGVSCGEHFGVDVFVPIDVVFDSVITAEWLAVCDFA